MNSPVILTAVSLVAAYLIGSVPAAYIAGRLKKGVDIRQVGSRNMGAMNVFYKVGFWTGMSVLAFDVGKGAAGVALARWLGVPDIAQLFVGAVVVIGHAFPVFLRFHGGRGGATCIGILVYLMPWGIPLYLGLFGLLLLLTHYPTLSYSAAFLGFPFIGALVYHRWELAIFSVGLPLIPGIKYLPRIKEMYNKGGGWRHVLLRQNLKDRL
ncbi:MAG: glycerol-3-phosphate acyltransferase [Chloroflexota bacterium]|nr:glycerol-3-phosphate acyltransferase [Chloroflexota bacterium]